VVFTLLMGRVIRKGDPLFLSCDGGPDALSFRMRYIEYIRDEARNEGSLGIVQPGQVLEVNEDQYHTAIASDSFRALACDVEEATERDPEDFPQPGPTPFYDLSRFPWHKPRLRERLRALPYRRVIDMAKAVQHITGQDVSWGTGVPRHYTVDEMVTLAIEFGWTSPPKHRGGVAI